MEGGCSGSIRRLAGSVRRVYVAHSRIGVWWSPGLLRRRRGTWVDTCRRSGARVPRHRGVRKAIRPETYQLLTCSSGERPVPAVAGPGRVPTSRPGAAKLTDRERPPSAPERRVATTDQRATQPPRRCRAVRTRRTRRSPSILSARRVPPAGRDATDSSPGRPWLSDFRRPTNRAGGPSVGDSLGLTGVARGRRETIDRPGRVGRSDATASPSPSNLILPP